MISQMSGVCIAWVFITNTRKGTHFSITMEHKDSSMSERRRRMRRTHCANPGDYWIAQILFWISG